jgi:hypothetical protein
MQSDINEADVNKAATKWIIDSANLTEQFKSLQGKDAAAAMPKYQQDLEALRQQYRSEPHEPDGSKAVRSADDAAVWLSNGGRGESRREPSSLVSE